MATLLGFQKGGVTDRSALRMGLLETGGNLPPHTLPIVSLVIASRNRPALLAATVASILAGEAVPAELLVVDQSDVPHPELSAARSDEGCEIRYVWTRTRGVARARNIALAAARNELLVLTDDDMLATPTWLESIVEALVAAGPQSVVTGKVIPTEAEVPSGFAPSTHKDIPATVYAGRVGIDVLFTGNMAIHRSALAAVGGFDERLGPGTHFPAAEDNDLGLRLLEAGYRIVYTPEAVLYHRTWRAGGERLRVMWNYGRGQGAFFAKHSHLHDPYILRRYLGELFHGAAAAARRTWRRGRPPAGDIVYLAGMLWGTLGWVARGAGTRLQRGAEG
jgi:GT2 family glycosyltransferase